MCHAVKKSYAKISQSIVEAHCLVEPYKVCRCKHGCMVEVCNRIVFTFHVGLPPVQEYLVYRNVQWNNVHFQHGTGTCAIIYLCECCVR